MDPVEGIVVGGVDTGEAHRIVRLLTATEGRVSFLARHARASKRRFAGVLEPGTRLRVHRQRGRGDLAIASEVDRLGGPDHARRDLDRITLLAYGCEVCALLAPEAHPAPKLYRLLEVWLDLLEGPVPLGVASRVALEAKALTFAGVAPALLVCSSCGAPLADPVVFDARAGGGLHARCGGGRGGLSARDLAALDALRRTPLADTVEVDAPRHPWILSDFAQHHLGRALRSRSMIEELQGSG